MNPLILPGMRCIISPPFVSDDIFGIKLFMEADISLNKETKTDYT